MEGRGDVSGEMEWISGFEMDEKTSDPHGMQFKESGIGWDSEIHFWMRIEERMG